MWIKKAKVVIISQLFIMLDISQCKQCHSKFTFHIPFLHFAIRITTVINESTFVSHPVTINNWKKGTYYIIGYLFEDTSIQFKTGTIILFFFEVPYNFVIDRRRLKNRILRLSLYITCTPIEL